MNFLDLYKSGSLGVLDFTIPIRERVQDKNGESISGMIKEEHNQINGLGIFVGYGGIYVGMQV